MFRLGASQISSLSFMVSRFFASLMVVALYANLSGIVLSTFCMSFSLGIFSPRMNDSFEISVTLHDTA